MTHKRGRSSEESKVTSTPRTMSPVDTSSPSVSSIDQEQEVPMEIDSESEFQESSGDISSSSSEHIELKSLRWPVNWSSLKPTVKESLYYKLMNQPKEVESIASDLVHICRSNMKKGILYILQLCVDLSGYKNVSLGKIYKYEQQNSQKVIDRLEDGFMDKELTETGKFLFITCSKFESKIEYIVAEFLTHLIANAFKSDILFDDFFATHVLQFINCMAFSRCRSLHVTGVILVIKFLTAYLMLYKQLVSVSEEETSFSSSSNEETDKKTKIENTIDFLYQIFEKNCLYPDSKSYAMRAVCAREIVQWIKLFPEVFIFKRKCLGHLMKLILDENDHVRLAALDTCGKLLAKEEIHSDMSERVELCLKITSGRFNDVNFKVVAKAICVFTMAINMYSESITHSYILSIIDFMYVQDLKVAKSAGKFLATYLQHKYANKEVLTSLAKTAYLKKERWELVSFFLESCIAFLPQLKEWPVIINILLGNETDFHTKRHLLKIFRETLMFTITGKFTRSRTSAFHVSLDDTIHQEIADVIMRNFEHLILVFQKDAACLTELFEILNIVNSELYGDQNKIVRILKNAFVANKDENLLKAVGKVLLRYCNNEENGQLSNPVIKKLIQDHVDTFVEDMGEMSPNSDKSLLIRLHDTTMKMSVIFEFFDPSEYIRWTQIFDVCKQDNLKSLKYTLVCCKWYLVWNLRQYIKNSQDSIQNINHLLYGNCKEFVYSCLDFLQQGKKDPESFLVFQVICDFYACFEGELIKKRTFSKFFIKIGERNYRDVLINFIVEHVIENNKLELRARQKYLSEFVDLVYLDVIPADEFSNILRYYHSHYTEFGEIMEHILSSLYTCNPGLPLLVQHTLASLYCEILKKRSVLNLLSGEVKVLRLLAKKFASFKLLKSRINLKLVNMIIRFGLKAEEYFPFLYFGRYFAELLKDEDKKETHKLFKTLVPKQHKHDNNILLFAQSLKS